MAKSVRYKDGTLMMPGSRALELYLDPPKAKTNGVKVEGLDGHMAELDKVWRKAEGRKPVAELTEREKMLEGRIPWNPALLKPVSGTISKTRLYPRETDHSVVSEGNVSPTPSGPHIGPNHSSWMTLKEIDSVLTVDIEEFGGRED